MKIRAKDTVLVIAGKDKGKKGEVMRTLKKKELIVVQGVNIRTKHIKKTAQKAGEIVKYEAPIHVSNVKLISPITGKPTRIGYLKNKGERKLRICKSSNEIIDKKK